MRHALIATLLATVLTFAAGTALADIVSPYTFDVLETMTTPFDDNIVVLCRNVVTRIHPGDYGFMIANRATATTYED